MPEPRAVPEDEVRERLAAAFNAPDFASRPWADQVSLTTWACHRQPSARPLSYRRALAAVGLRWDGTAYHDTEGSRE